MNTAVWNSYLRKDIIFDLLNRPHVDANESEGASLQTWRKMWANGWPLRIRAGQRKKRCHDPVCSLPKCAHRDVIRCTPIVEGEGGK